MKVIDQWLWKKEENLANICQLLAPSVNVSAKYPNILPWKMIDAINVCHSQTVFKNLKTQKYQPGLHKVAHLHIPIIK